MRRNRLYPMDGAPGVMCGPAWHAWRTCQRRCNCGVCASPRMRLNGRWVSSARASHQLWVSKVLPWRKTVQDRRADLRHRIGQFLGRWDDLPF